MSDDKDNKLVQSELDVLARYHLIEELSSSERRYQSLVEHIQEIVFKANNKLCFTFLNHAWEVITGFTREEALSHPIKEFIHNDSLYDWEQIVQADKNLFEIKIPELSLKHKDGHTCLVTLYLEREQHKDEWIGSMHDISERKVTESLRIAKEQAELNNHAKSNFLARISHELRTPLNAILGFGQLMYLDNALDSQHKENVHEILSAGRHLLNLINEVLDLTKIESGKMELSPDIVAVQPLLEECINLVKSLANEHGITLNYSKSRDDTIIVDRVKLKQILLNLLSNAIKYNHKDGKVTINSSINDNNKLLIHIQDTGKGIPSDQLNNIFQPFNRLDAELSNIEGTGIGLTLTKQLIEHMDGQIGVKSQLGSGSTFWIELPINLQTNCKPHIASHEQAIKYDHKLAQKRKVLYIEDNQANLKLVERVLKAQPHIQFISADEPELGIKLAKQHLPDLVLLDINLPGMSGYDVLNILKSNSDLEKVPVIAISADIMLHKEEQVKKSGFDRYITKPFNIHEFITTVNSYITN